MGLEPTEVMQDMRQELNDWAKLGVEGHFKEKDNWYRYHEKFAEPLSKIVGAKPDEVVVMNSLIVNLHLMMASFYSPKGKKPKLLSNRYYFLLTYTLLKTR